MFKPVALLSTFALLLASSALAQFEDSNVIDEPCPELFLEEEMVQGPQLTQEDFDNKVVLFLFYQRDCDGCERHAMPRLQKLYEDWINKPCVLVVAINTAFDKDDYPYLADVPETRKHLQRMEWTMPVLRDLDEKSNALFEVDEVSGTPQAAVLDVDGTVRAHDWFSEEEEMNEIEGVFVRLASRLNCDCIPMPRKVTPVCKRARDAIKDGEYAKAYDLAKTIKDSYGYTEEDKEDATYLAGFVKDIATERMERARTNFDYDPPAAIADAEGVIDDFKGVDGVVDLQTQIDEWRASDTLKDFNRLADELNEIGSAIDQKLGNKDGKDTGDKETPANGKSPNAEIGTSDAEDWRAGMRERLEAIARESGDTSVADRARERLEAISDPKDADVEIGTDNEASQASDKDDRDSSRPGRDDRGRTGMKPAGSSGRSVKDGGKKEDSNRKNRISSNRSHR